MYTNEPKLLIPDYDPYKPEPYPGDIYAGYHSEAEPSNSWKNARTTRRLCSLSGICWRIRMNRIFALAQENPNAEGWQRVLFAFLAKKEQRSGLRRTIVGYSRMLQTLFSRVGKQPDQITSQIFLCTPMFQVFPACEPFPGRQLAATTPCYAD